MFRVRMHVAILVALAPLAALWIFLDTVAPGKWYTLATPWVGGLVSAYYAIKLRNWLEDRTKDIPSK